MNKLPLGLSSQRTSANSSFSTLKNFDFNSFSDTAQKQHLQGKRFSYQESHETSQKENKRDNAARPQNQMACFNHPHTAAQFTALENSDDPMYLCQRCAILVASKGFQITKLMDRKFKKEGSFTLDLQKEAGDTFASLKLHKNQALEKLELFAEKLEKKVDFLEEYFAALHDFIQREKNSLLREIVVRRREIESLREQSSNFYLGLMERVREISLQAGMVGLNKAGDMTRELRDLKKQAFDIPFDSLKFPISLLNINQLCQQLGALIREKECRQGGNEKEFEFKLKCDEEHSEIRSLKLSFEEQNNFTLAQETNRTGELH